MFTCLLLGIGCVSIGSTQTASLTGVVRDQDTQDSVPFATVALYRNGVLITGMDTDFDGSYTFDLIDDGLYDIEAMFLGYQKSRVEGVSVQSAKVNIINFELVEAHNFGCGLTSYTYRIPLISLDETSTGQTIRPHDRSTMHPTPIRLFKGRKQRKKSKKRRKRN